MHGRRRQAWLLAIDSAWPSVGSRAGYRAAPGQSQGCNRNTELDASEADHAQATLAARTDKAPKMEPIISWAVSGPSEGGRR